MKIVLNGKYTSIILRQKLVAGCKCVQFNIQNWIYSKIVNFDLTIIKLWSCKMYDV